MTKQEAAIVLNLLSMLNLSLESDKFTKDAFEALRMGVEALCPENPPLTVEELEKMDGEPVWVVDMDENPIEPEWGIANLFCNPNNSITFKDGTHVLFSEIERGEWRAYRHKPEGVE